MGQYFTYITGILTIVAFLLQLRDVFPKHREARKSILLIAFGVFLGSVIGSIDRIEIKMETAIHPVSLVLVVFLAILVFGAVVTAFVAVQTENGEKRNELYNLSGGIVGVFFFVLLATGASFGLSGVEEEQKSLSAQELIELSNLHMRIGNYEKSLAYLDKLKFSFRMDDPRRQRAEEEIERVKSAMANSLNHNNAETPNTYQAPGRQE